MEFGKEVAITGQINFGRFTTFNIYPEKRDAAATEKEVNHTVFQTLNSENLVSFASSQNPFKGRGNERRSLP